MVTSEVNTPDMDYSSLSACRTELEKVKQRIEYLRLRDKLLDNSTYPAMAQAKRQAEMTRDILREFQIFSHRTAKVFAFLGNKMMYSSAATELLNVPENTGSQAHIQSSSRPVRDSPGPSLRRVSSVPNSRLSVSERLDRAKERREMSEKIRGITDTHRPTSRHFQSSPFPPASKRWATTSSIQKRPTEVSVPVQKRIKREHDKLLSVPSTDNLSRVNAKRVPVAPPARRTSIVPYKKQLSTSMRSRVSNARLTTVLRTSRAPRVSVISETSAARTSLAPPLSSNGSSFRPHLRENQQAVHRALMQRPGPPDDPQRINLSIERQFEQPVQPRRQPQLHPQTQKQQVQTYSQQIVPRRATIAPQAVPRRGTVALPARQPVQKPAIDNRPWYVRLCPPSAGARRATNQPTRAALPTRATLPTRTTNRSTRAIIAPQRIPVNRACVASTSTSGPRRIPLDVNRLVAQTNQVIVYQPTTSNRPAVVYPERRATQLPASHSANKTGVQPSVRGMFSVVPYRQNASRNPEHIGVRSSIAAPRGSVYGATIPESAAPSGVLSSTYLSSARRSSLRHGSQSSLYPSNLLRPLSRPRSRAFRDSVARLSQIFPRSSGRDTKPE